MSNLLWTRFTFIFVSPKDKNVMIKKQCPWLSSLKFIDHSTISFPSYELLSDDYSALGGRPNFKRRPGLITNTESSIVGGEAYLSHCRHGYVYCGCWAGENVLEGAQVEQRSPGKWDQKQVSKCLAVAQFFWRVKCNSQEYWRPTRKLRFVNLRNALSEVTRNRSRYHNSRDNDLAKNCCHSWFWNMVARWENPEVWQKSEILEREKKMNPSMSKS